MHRYAPVANAPRQRNQPPETLHFDPPNSFDNKPCYINFSHPIDCTVVFKSGLLRPNVAQVSPGRALMIGLKDQHVPLEITISEEEKKKLMKLHWRYWSGRRYEFDPDLQLRGDSGNKGGHDGGNNGGNQEGDNQDGDNNHEDNKAEDSNKNQRQDRHALQGGTNGDEARMPWAERVAYALDNPIVPEEPEHDILPQLVIVADLPSDLLWMVGEADEGLDDCLEQYGQRLAV